jgi:hypothetical protein
MDALAAELDRLRGLLPEAAAGPSTPASQAQPEPAGWNAELD